MAMTREMPLAAVLMLKSPEGRGDRKSPCSMEAREQWRDGGGSATRSAFLISYRSCSIASGRRIGINRSSGGEARGVDKDNSLGWADKQRKVMRRKDEWRDGWMC